jgi:hypothetical protein
MCFPLPTQRWRLRQDHSSRHLGSSRTTLQGDLPAAVYLLQLMLVCQGCGCCISGARCASSSECPLPGNRVLGVPACSLRGSEASQSWQLYTHSAYNHCMRTGGLFCCACSLACRMAPPAPCVSYSGEHAGMQVHVIWNGQDKEHGVDLIGTGASMAERGSTQAATACKARCFAHQSLQWSRRDPASKQASIHLVSQAAKHRPRRLAAILHESNSAFTHMLKLLAHAHTYTCWLCCCCSPCQPVHLPGLSSLQP